MTTTLQKITTAEDVIRAYHTLPPEEQRKVDDYFQPEELSPEEEKEVLRRLREADAGINVSREFHSVEEMMDHINAQIHHDSKV